MLVKEINLLYHVHHSQHSEDLPFWEELAGQHPGPILELGCGTGRVALCLASQGFQVYGLDRDGDMLTALQANLTPQVRPKVGIFQADMTCFHLEQHFGLILLPCNTYSTLLEGERCSTLACVRRHLRRDGVFAASLPNPSILRSLPRSTEPEVEEVFPHPVDGEPVQVSSNWQRSYKHVSMYWHYDHLLPDGRVERQTLHSRHALLPAQAYLDEMHRQGFTLLETYGDFDRSPYSSESPYLIILASQKTSPFFFWKKGDGQE